MILAASIAQGAHGSQELVPQGGVELAPQERAKLVHHGRDFIGRPIAVVLGQALQGRPLQALHAAEETPARGCVGVGPRGGRACVALGGRGCVAPRGGRGGVAPRGARAASARAEAGAASPWAEAGAASPRLGAGAASPRAGAGAASPRAEAGAAGAGLSQRKRTSLYPFRSSKLRQMQEHSLIHCLCCALITSIITRAIFCSERLCTGRSRTWRSLCSTSRERWDTAHDTGERAACHALAQSSTEGTAPRRRPSSSTVSCSKNWIGASGRKKWATARRCVSDVACCLTCSACSVEVRTSCLDQAVPSRPRHLRFGPAEFGMSPCSARQAKSAHRRQPKPQAPPQRDGRSASHSTRARGPARSPRRARSSHGPVRWQPPVPEDIPPATTARSASSPVSTQVRLSRLEDRTHDDLVPAAGGISGRLRPAAGGSSGRLRAAPRGRPARRRRRRRGRCRRRRGRRAGPGAPLRHGGPRGREPPRPCAAARASPSPAKGLRALADVSGLFLSTLATATAEPWLAQPWPRLGQGWQ